MVDAADVSGGTPGEHDEHDEHDEHGGTDDGARVSRRDFLSAAIAVPLVARLRGNESADPFHAAAQRESVDPSSLLTIDYARLLRRADLVYERPPDHSEEGIPVGNGRMGSLVWTTPSAMHLQINRVDVYGNDASSDSFFERHNDYCGGCGFVDVEVGEGGDEIFPAAGFRQRLSVHDGLLTMEGKGVSARVIASPAADVMAIALDDRRTTPNEIRVRLRMLRYAAQSFDGEVQKLAESHTVAVRTRSQRADSRLSVHGDRIVLQQEFREGEFVCRSAVAIAMTGRRGHAEIANLAEVRLSAPPAARAAVVLIASAASFDPAVDVVAAALGQLDQARRKSFAALSAETADWWHDFWTRGFVHLHSADGVADFVEQHYHYYLYVMAASSRGSLPPKFNGMIWNTGGDLRTWGTQHWFANLSCYYEALPAANHVELMGPMYAMYSGMYDACARAARQQWGSQGIFIPETVFFNGLATLPDDIAQEMRELYLTRKPWEQRSQRFRTFAETKHPHSSRWNWIGSGKWVDGRWEIADRGAGPYGPVTHNLGTTAKIAVLYWRRYEYTLDADWLRTRAYPMLRGAAELYRNFPNVRKGDDGRIHIYGTNSNESIWGGTDSDEDLSSLRGLLPVAIRAAELLKVDPELRTAWSALLAELAPLPASDDPLALVPAGYAGPRVFVRSRRPVVRGQGFLPDPNSLPMWFFDLCAVETRDATMRQTAAATFDGYFADGITERTPVSVLSKLAIAAASIGRADAVRHLIPNQIRALQAERATAYQGGRPLANRMTLREGPQALDAQRLGRAAEALHLALLQSAPPAPGEEPILHVFPACPTEWDVAFTLLARGAFLVTASRRGGRVEFVELESRAGASCQLRNPWGEADVTLHRDGRAAERLSGSLLRFPTRAGERLVVVPSGTSPGPLRRTIAAS
jgi:hypothetical protein